MELTPAVGVLWIEQLDATPENSKQPSQRNSRSIAPLKPGDNLEALRHLQNAYSGAVKVIYIDPPYNTGQEFVYSDNFEWKDEDLKERLGYSDEEIKRLHITYYLQKAGLNI